MYNKREGRKTMSNKEFYDSWKQEHIDNPEFTKAEQTLTKIPDDEVLVLKNEDRLIAVAWSGKRSKYDWYYRFQDKKQMDKYISDYFCKLEDIARLKIERKEQKKKEKQEFFDSIQVGDIFVDSWGYDQTNVDFYKVTKKLKASIKVVKIGNETVADYTSALLVIPRESIHTSEEITKVSQDGYIRTSSFSYAWPWNGKPMHETAAGWGH
tara:strand:+ start:197 stop:826 length:630 start_codon:yes stop_codon:yes gene_type:complete